MTSLTHSSTTRNFSQLRLLNMFTLNCHLDFLSISHFTKIFTRQLDQLKLRLNLKCSLNQRLRHFDSNFLSSLHCSSLGLAKIQFSSTIFFNSFPSSWWSERRFTAFVERKKFFFSILKTLSTNQFTSMAKMNVGKIERTM